MFYIEKVNGKEEKQSITLVTMNALPEWFSNPEEIMQKSYIHRECPFFVAYDGANIIGFIALYPHNEKVAELYTVAVLREYHQQAVAKNLFSAALHETASVRYQYITAKIPDSHEHSEMFTPVREFLISESFIELEHFSSLPTTKEPVSYWIKRVNYSL
ncbi:MAG TPA: GNAT family N-acetyltransferase [Bacillota bacterium]|nr:GNAT family N-acetyltransferase [Bacillota bacterium]HPE39088.1 GNAT family N-acetyltransferase [Bacillota bacterium]